MGSYKELLYGGDEYRGHRLPNEGQFVCADHFDDHYLAGHIRSAARDGKCTFCGKRTPVMDFTEFIEYIFRKLNRFFTDPANEPMYLWSSFFDKEDNDIRGFKNVGGFICPNHAITYDSARELMCDVELETDNEKLNKAIEGCFLNDIFVQEFPIIKRTDQELYDLWSTYCHTLKTKSELSYKDIQKLLRPVDSDNGLDDILTEIGKGIMSLRLIHVIAAGTELYRCRPLCPTDTCTGFKDITSAPSVAAKANRMSRQGQSRFYGGFVPETGFAEARCKPGDMHAIGRFVTKKELAVLDLTKLPPHGFWADDWLTTGFLNTFRADITKHVPSTSDYLPSQVFTDWLDNGYLYKGRKIDGILFPSNLHRGHNNIVLFYDNISSGNILDLKELFTLQPQEK